MAYRREDGTRGPGGELNYGPTIEVLCRGCGKTIGQMKRLKSPSEWKAFTGLSNCPECQRPLAKQFEIVRRDKK